MKIHRFEAEVVNIKDLSLSAREVSFALPKDLKEFSFQPGQFMNFFVEIDGKKERRAYSLSSSSQNKKEISFCIRNEERGKVSPVFWEENIVGKKFNLMGPIGLNTVDKFEYEKVVLVAMGVGISPVKSIAEFLVSETDKKVELFFGNKNEDQILYKDFFDDLRERHTNFSVNYVLSEPKNLEYSKIGFVQDFLDGIDFENTTIYMCGIPQMAEACKKKIQEKKPMNVQIMEESFD